MHHNWHQYRTQHQVQSAYMLACDQKGLLMVYAGPNGNQDLTLHLHQVYTVAAAVAEDGQTSSRSKVA
jgi:hypothetical protein